MKAVVEPGQQPCLGSGQVDPRHADLGESQGAGPVPDLRHQTRTVDLSLAEHHLPIVETLVWADEDATRRFAERLARVPALRDAFIELHGDLGAGKTTLARHLLRALGVSGRVKSPTYAVVEPYELLGLPAWHFDFYRFDDPREWDDAGFRDLFASPGLKLAEWPEKAGALLPRADLSITLEAEADATRRVRLEARTATGVRLLEGAAA